MRRAVFLAVAIVLSACGETPAYRDKDWALVQNDAAACVYARRQPVVLGVLGYRPYAYTEFRRYDAGDIRDPEHGCPHDGIDFVGRIDAELGGMP